MVGYPVKEDLHPCHVQSTLSEFNSKQRRFIRNQNQSKSLKPNIQLGFWPKRERGSGLGDGRIPS